MQRLGSLMSLQLPTLLGHDFSRTKDYNIVEYSLGYLMHVGARPLKIGVLEILLGMSCTVNIGAPVVMHDDKTSRPRNTYPFLVPESL
ncbi:hypothetical protein K440DRAFT_135956 [Wilcoxina mikolae CBS 423.85]|nr:hypothetical protein K440DRAFT_135956 [Wilcoxina mikolae CBS 423.85]